MKTPSQKAIRWIEAYCVYPHGFSKGQHVVLTERQRAALRQIFDTDESPEVTGPLAAYLALFHVAGPRDLAAHVSGVELDADIFFLGCYRPRSARRVEARRRGHRLARAWHAMANGGMKPASLFR